MSQKQMAYQRTFSGDFKLFVSGAIWDGIKHMLKVQDTFLDLWDSEEGFFYDYLRLNGKSYPLRIRSMVGLVPLFAVHVIEPDVMKKLPDFAAKTRWFINNRPDLSQRVSKATQFALLITLYIYHIFT